MIPMDDHTAAAILRNMFICGTMARGDGKSGITSLRREAIVKAILALERRARAKKVETVGRLFKRWLCPSCFQRVSRGGNFCPRCGQAYAPPPKKKKRIVICDEWDCPSKKTN